MKGILIKNVDSKHLCSPTVRDNAMYCELAFVSETANPLYSGPMSVASVKSFSCPSVEPLTCKRRIGVNAVTVEIACW